MMDAQTLDYTFDEESIGFSEPPRAAEIPSRPGEKAGVTLMALGALGLCVAIASPDFGGTWLGLLASFGPIVLGSVLFFWFRFKDKNPGIKHDGTFFSNVQNRGALAFGVGIFLTGFYVVLYFRDRLLAQGIDPLAGAINILHPLSHALRRAPSDQWFLYGFLYTLAVLIFGFRMLMKYRHNRYQQLRTLSVSFFQLIFAFILPGVLKATANKEFYLTYFWPLKPEYLFPSSFHDLVQRGGFGYFLLAWSLGAALIATPVLTYFYGKRWYCSWVCGCGGLAETLGDPWRQLSSKSLLSWKIERVVIYSVLGLIIATTVFIWSQADSAGYLPTGSIAAHLNEFYGLYIGALFSGVVGVGFYPLMGSRVWCRFGCPMAAILGLFQRTWSRFRITTNGDQCMSCGNCSTYCEMGIDVRAYAQRGENIVRASCVGCGVCSAVCPRGVLNLENGTSPKDRFDGAESPVGVFLAGLKSPNPHER